MRIGLLAIAAIATGLGSGPSYAAPPSLPLAITNVCVVPMTASGGPSCGRTVVVRDGRIAQIAAARAASIPADAQRIDGRGKWLMPGLTDMHVHVENEELFRALLGDPAIPEGAAKPDDIFLPYLANGVLQIANLAGTTQSLQQRAQLESGAVAGPHMVVAAMVDGSPPIWPPGVTRVAATPAEGRETVRKVKAEGYDFVKVYSNLSAETYDAILDEAANSKLRVLGHIPGRQKRSPETFLKPGLTMVTHAEEFAYQVGEDQAAIPRLTQLALASGVWVTPTLTLDERILQQAEAPDTLKTRPELAYLHPLARRFWTERNAYVGNAGLAAYVRKVVAFNRALVVAFAKAGVPIVAGTDSLVPGVAPGFALHDELEALQGLGLAPEIVLAGATRRSAEYLGVGDDRGTVEVGKRADLILLTADPLTSVSNTRAIAYVVRDGHAYSRAQLDSRMTDLKARYAADQKPPAKAPSR